jgi:hypothetical protein
MTAPTMAETTDEGAVDSTLPATAGAAANWWYDWVDERRVAAAVLVGLMATQLGTYFGYVFPAIGLPELPWPLYNGALAAPAEEYGTVGSFFAGQSLHFVNGIVFALLYAALVRPMMPFRNNHAGNVLSGLAFGVVMTIVSVGVLVPYAYVPNQGYGFFSFSGPDGWKLPAGVLLWHLIYGLVLGVFYQVRGTRRA